MIWVVIFGGFVVMCFNYVDVFGGFWEVSFVWLVLCFFINLYYLLIWVNIGVVFNWFWLLVFVLMDVLVIYCESIFVKLIFYVFKVIF